MLGGNPAQGSTPATNLLYTGEQWDTDSQHYYNRARWYNPMNGLFNRMDPYAGNTQDPQSLHKYLYCHNNPVNGIDPSGMFSIIRVALTVAIVATFLTIGLVAYTAHKTKRTFFGVVKDVDGALFKGCFLDVKIDGAYKQMRPKTILVKYKSCIEDSARKEGIPPDLLAGVLNTEMRNYGILDIFGDDFAYGSIGPAQMKVVNVKKWIPELKSKSDKEVEDLLLDPETAIDILAKAIKEFNGMAKDDIIGEFRATRDKQERAMWSGKMSSAKDNWGAYSYNWYMTTHGPAMYLTALDVLWDGNIPE